MKVLIFSTDRFSKRNIESSGLIDLMNSNGHKAILMTVNQPTSLTLKIINKFRIVIYKKLHFRFAEISGWKKQQFKKEHPENFEYDAKLGWPFPKSKFLFSILNFIFVNLPSHANIDSDADIVLVTSCQDAIAQSVIKIAEKKNIPVVCMVNSWDHLTHGSKALSSKQIKSYFVWNQIQKNELIHFHRINQERIQIVGALQFDFLFKKPTNDYSIILKEKFKISKNQKIIFLPAYNERHGRFEPNAIEHILRNKDKIDSDFKVIIRPYPNKEDFIARFSRFENDPNCTFVFPAEDPIEDRELMKGLLQFSDIVLSGAGTVTIEAMFFNKPVIHLGIEPKESKGNNYLFKKFYFSDHFQHIMKHKASVFAETYKELIEGINRYLKSPSLQFENRQNLLREQLYFTDGKTYERIGNALMRLAKKNGKGD